MTQMKEFEVYVTPVVARSLMKTHHFTLIIRQLTSRIEGMTRLRVVAPDAVYVITELFEFTSPFLCRPVINGRVTNFTKGKPFWINRAYAAYYPKQPYKTLKAHLDEYYFTTMVQSL